MYGNERELMYSLKKSLGNKSLLNLKFLICLKQSKKAGEVNTNMPNWVVGKLIDALNESGKSVKDSRILMLGITYKKNIDDLRESPAIEMIELLKEKGALVDYSDPFIKFIPKMRNHKLDLSCVKIDEVSITNYDCLVLATDHDAFDYSMIQSCAKLIIDTRGVYPDKFDNVIKA